jgi:carbon-monoxide dehydrogenase medium subunit
MALDAVVTLKSTRGERRVPLREFYTGVRRTVMAPDELLTEIAFPALPANERGIFFKLALRRAQAISVVNVAAIVQRAEAGSVQRTRIALGAVAPTIVRATGAEAFLVNKTLTPSIIAQAGELAQAAARPISDVRGPAEYRAEMVKVLTVRTLRAIAAGQERGALPERPIVLADRNGDRGRRTADGGPWSVVGGPISTTINGRAYTITGANDKTLLRLLREDCGLIGTKEGCAEGECGACTVYLDGAAVMACLVPAPRAHGAEIVTVEGLAAMLPDGQPQTVDGGQLSTVNRLHPLQRAFIETGAVQCGYCTPGFLMAGAKLLEERSHPAKNEIEQALTGNLCRCTGYYKIVAAFEKASQIFE